MAWNLAYRPADLKLRGPAGYLWCGPSPSGSWSVFPSSLSYDIVCGCFSNPLGVFPPHHLLCEARCFYDVRQAEEEVGEQLVQVLPGLRLILYSTVCAGVAVGVT